jgi:molybdate transport system substrate-binding protein
MRTVSKMLRALALVVAATTAFAAAAAADEIRVMTSGGFTAAYLDLVPEFERITVFAAGIAVGARAPDAARSLIAFFASPAAVRAIAKSGFEPVTSR